jgi:hypothetical protein
MKKENLIPILEFCKMKHTSKQWVYLNIERGRLNSEKFGSGRFIINDDLAKNFKVHSNSAKKQSSILQ